MRPGLLGIMAIFGAILTNAASAQLQRALQPGAAGQPAAAANPAPPAEWDDAAVESAIARAKEALWSEWSTGHWPEPANYKYGGLTALCAYALLAAGESPRSERMKQTLEWLAKAEMTGTYARALRANVWASLGHSSQYRQNLQADVDWLVAAADSQGGYTYTAAAKPKDTYSAGSANRVYDNSNSQFGVLGVWAGARSGIEVDGKYWQKVQRHWQECQSVDGGWSYRKGSPSYGSMTAAGLATMFVCYDNLYGHSLSGRGDLPQGELQRGLGWLDKNFSAQTNPNKGDSNFHYYLYAIERVGLASGYKCFGEQDWYKLGTAALLSRQGQAGWGSLPNTCFGLLFLARGRQAVLFNKLQYSGAWNSRSRDLANFTRWASGTFERELNWQIIHLGVPVSQWHDAPILYISGASAPKFTQEQLGRLRDFVLQGGVIFSEAADNSVAFTMAMKKHYAQMFPQYELAQLPAEHPVFSKEVQFAIQLPRGLMGLSNGVRFYALHAPAEMSRQLQLNNSTTGANVFQLMANLYMYVTDRGILPPRGVTHWPTPGAVQPTRKASLAVVKHAGNWDPEPLAMHRLALLLANRHQVGLELSEPMELKELDARKWPLAAMTGTGSVDFDEQQQAALERYLRDGGTFFIDAAGGDEAFIGSAGKLLEPLIAQGQYGPLPAEHELYRLAGLGIEKVGYRAASRRAMADATRPRLRGLSLNGRLAVIFSREDVTCGLVGYPCWGLKGYSPQSAFELMRNIVLYSCLPRPARSDAASQPAAASAASQAGTAQPASQPAASQPEVAQPMAEPGDSSGQDDSVIWWKAPQ